MPFARGFRRRGRAGAALPALLLLSSPASALKWPKLPELPKIHLPTSVDAYEFEGGLTSFGFQLGAALPAGANDFSAAVSGGPSFNVRYLRYLTNWIALGAEGGVTRFNRRIQESSPSGPLLVPGASAQTMRATALTLDAIARVNVFEQGAWTPYLLGGAGLSNFSANGRVTIPGGIPPDQGFKSSTKGLFVTGAAGVEAFLIRGLSATFEARYGKYPLDKAFRSKSAESLSYLLGLNFWFGKSAER
ncbi:MAG: outer membrane beta-barrel protein [Elusimicrobia bacterium]|nr:outer membrane beta-barrel protein [Elusimicrobiota bacterium]